MKNCLKTLNKKFGELNHLSNQTTKSTEISLVVASDCDKDFILEFI